MVIDHIGIVVKSIDAAIARWRELFGYEPVTEPVVNTHHKVRVVFLEKPGSIQIKLVEPVDGTSPAAGLAARGGGLHHLCFRTEDLDGTLATLRPKDVRVLSEPTPGEAFDLEPIAFVYAQQGLNIELIATEKRARRLPKAPNPAKGP